MNRSPLFALPPPAAPESAESVWPLWTVYVAAVASGAIILAGSMGASVTRAPALAAASALLFGAFGAVCVWLLNRIHYFWPVGREAKLLAALWGAFAAIGYALPANLAIYTRFAARQDASAWSLFAPFTEEPMKNLGIVVVLLLAAPRPRTALDGLVVGSFVGLGFEVVENVVQSLTNAITSSPPGHPGQWASLATDVIHEVVRRSWTGHIVITGIAGFGIAYAMTARDRPVPQRLGDPGPAVARVLGAVEQTETRRRDHGDATRDRRAAGAGAAARRLRILLDCRRRAAVRVGARCVLLGSQPARAGAVLGQRGRRGWIAGRSGGHLGRR